VHGLLLLDCGRPELVGWAMPTLLNDPAHWQLRADETRLLAEHLIDHEAKATTLKIADEYDRLALRALERMQEENAPKANDLNRSTTLRSPCERSIYCWVAQDRA
jgi:hypothetical protein